MDRQRITEFYLTASQTPRPSSDWNFAWHEHEHELLPQFAWNFTGAMNRPAVSDVLQSASIATSDAIIQNMPQFPMLQYHGFAVGQYLPFIDTVQLPPLDKFVSPARYYQTLFHELAHSTGHSSRMNRPTMAAYENQMYCYCPLHNRAIEEFIAEMCSGFLCAEAGIFEPISDLMGCYISNWAQAVDRDKSVILDSARQASDVADWILGRK